MKSSTISLDDHQAGVFDDQPDHDPGLGSEELWDMLLEKKMENF